MEPCLSSTFIAILRGIKLVLLEFSKLTGESVDKKTTQTGRFGCHGEEHGRVVFGSTRPLKVLIFLISTLPLDSGCSLVHAACKRLATGTLSPSLAEGCQAPVCASLGTEQGCIHQSCPGIRGSDGSAGFFRFLQVWLPASRLQPHLRSPGQQTGLRR